MWIFDILFILFIIISISTLSLYLISYYDIMNCGQSGSLERWPQNIPAGSIAKGIIVEILSSFTHMLTYPLLLFYNRLSMSDLSCTKSPILLVHGWGSGSHAFFLMHWFLKKKGYTNIVSLTYRPVFANCTILARQVADKVNEITLKTGATEVDIIAHSLGGKSTLQATWQSPFCVNWPKTA